MIIERYFPGITDRQKEQFERLLSLYPEWNEKINVISRKDIDNLEIHHLLHSLSIGKFLNPIAGTTFLDVGTGGGLPGIPMAVMYPDCRFHLIDRIGKKIRVATEIANEIGLTNVTLQQGDLGECHERFDYVVSRAVMSIGDLWRISRKNISGKQRHNAYPNGLIALKGGELKTELSALNIDYFVEDISLWFHEDYFKTKKLIYIPL